MTFVVLVVAMALLGAYMLDHPKILESAGSVKVTLDRIDTHALSSPSMMRADLSERLGVDVMSYHIVAFDYINDKASVNVYFKKPLEDMGA